MWGIRIIVLIAPFIVLFSASFIFFKISSNHPNITGGVMPESWNWDKYAIDETFARIRQTRPCFEPSPFFRDLSFIRESLPRLCSIWYRLAIPSLILLLLAPEIGNIIHIIALAYLLLVCMCRISGIRGCLIFKHALPADAAESYSVVVRLELVRFVHTAMQTALFGALHLYLL